MASVKQLFKITKGKKEELLETDGINSLRYIQIDDLRNDNNIKYCKKHSKNVMAEPKDIIIAWDGANAGTIGVGLNGAIGSTLARLESKSDDVYPYYVAKFLQSKFQYLRDNCTGATIPHISKVVLESLIIQLPSLPNQKKIVEVLDKAQELTDARKAQIRLLDDLIQSVFFDMFGDPVTNPKGWGKEKLGEICDVYRGGSPRPIKDFLGGTIPWIKIGDATNGDDVYLRSTKERIIEDGIKRSRMVKKGSLIFANCGVSLGFARIIEFDGCIHDGWLSFENINKSIEKIFILKLLNCYTEYFRNSAPDGTQPNLNTKIMKAFEIIIPPLEIQTSYSLKIDRLLAQKELMQQSLLELESNFNSLMQRAFKDELFISK